jgi:fructose-bisphosphate aldolase class I
MVDLSESARLLMMPGKGLLAADETDSHADRWLKEHGIEGGEEMRREFRELFLATPGAEAYLSGVILFTETLEQKTHDGVPFPMLLSEHDIIPGVKVDLGLEPFPESKDETITSGLIGLPERLAEYRSKYGTGFTKWRAAIKIEGDRLPTTSAIVENAKRLAMYAREVQSAGMLPIVEPEVLLDGNHSRLRAREVIAKTMHALIAAMEDQAVDLSGVIIKTSMALSGSASGHTDTPEEIAEDTLGALMEAVPAIIPGIVFLSGGQTPDQATENLRAICKRARDAAKSPSGDNATESPSGGDAGAQAPWPLTYSFARAFQEEAVAVWAGKKENIPAAREAFLSRIRKASQATLS